MLQKHQYIFIPINIPPLSRRKSGQVVVATLYNRYAYFYQHQNPPGLKPPLPSFISISILFFSFVQIAYSLMPFAVKNFKSMSKSSITTYVSSVTTYILCRYMDIPFSSMDKPCISMGIFSPLWTYYPSLWTYHASLWTNQASLWTNYASLWTNHASLVVNSFIFNASEKDYVK